MSVVTGTAAARQRPGSAGARSAGGTIVPGQRAHSRAGKGTRDLVTLVPGTNLERLVKSTDRVQDLGEVFTPAAIVQEMLNLLPDQMWTPHPSPTFLEPACGDGNFLVAILDRKLAALRTLTGTGERIQNYALEALSSIYGVDISEENVMGGTDEHPVGARTRMLNVFSARVPELTGAPWDPDSDLARSAQWIVERNVQVGNMLETTPEGVPTGREDLPLCEYTFNHTEGTATIATTTLGAVQHEAAERAGGVTTLFGPPPPLVVWTGPATLLFNAPASPERAKKRRAR